MYWPTLRLSLLLMLLPLATLANTAPVANDDTIHSPAPPGPFTFDVLANDSDADGDQLTITSVGSSTAGTAEIIANKIRFTPGVTFKGNATIAYSVSDGHGGTASAALRLKNTAPRAAIDFYSVFSNTTTVLPILQNVTDPDGDSLHLVSTSLQANGTIERNSVVLKTDAQGPSRFTYTVSDDWGTETTGTVLLLPVPLITPAVGLYGAKLSGSYNEAGATFHVEYGLDLPYTQSTAEKSATGLEATVENLRPGTSYHYRFVVTTPTYSFASADLVFTTGAAGSLPALYAACPGQLVALDSRGLRRTVTTAFTPGQIVFGDDGNFYVSDASSGKVWRIAADQTLTAYANGLVGPTGLAFADDGSLFVAVETNGTSGPRSNILRITSSGVRTTFATDLPSISELVFGSSGSLYAAPLVTSAGGTGLIRIAPNGTTTTIGAEWSIAGSVVRTRFGNLYAVTTDPYAGFVRISEDTGAVTRQISWPRNPVAVAATNVFGLDSFYFADDSGGVMRQFFDGAPFATGTGAATHLGAPTTYELKLLPPSAVSSSAVILHGQIKSGGVKLWVRFGYGPKDYTENFTPWVEYDPQLGTQEVTAVVTTLYPNATYTTGFQVSTSGTSANASTYGTTFATLAADPVAVADSYHLPLNTAPFDLDVLANDGPGLTITSVNQSIPLPSHGRVEPPMPEGGQPNGQPPRVRIQNNHLIYAPLAGFDGNDYFTYTVTDAFGATSTASVTLSNAAPVAAFDSVAVRRGQTALLRVLDNDSDPDDDVLFITSLTQPQHGVATNLGTLISFAPDASFHGDDSFAYTISDGHGKTAVGKVSLHQSESIIDRVAAKGDATLVAAAGTLRTFGLPTINDAGDVAFQATTQGSARVASGIFVVPAPGPVTIANPAQPIALAGDPAPGLMGATFAAFFDPVLDERGHVAFQARAAMPNGAVITGIWSNANASSLLSLVAATGQNARLTVPTTYSGFAGLALSEAGPIFVATLNTASDRNVAIYASAPGGAPRVILQKGALLPFSTTRRISSLAIFGALTGTLDQRRGFSVEGALLIRSGLTDGGAALLRIDPHDALEPIVTVPNLAKTPLSVGTVATDGPAYFRSGTAIVAHRFVTTQSGALALNGGSPSGFTSRTETVAKLGEIAPGVPGSNLARFKTLGDPVANPAGDVAFTGSIGIAPPVTLARNDSGIWFAREGETPALIVREGDRAPGVIGAFLTSFTSLAMPGDRGIAFTGVASFPVPVSIPPRPAPAPVRGLWAQDSSGELQLLLRVGETPHIFVNPHQDIVAPPILAFDVLATTPTAPSQGRSANARGGFVVRVTYQDRTQALLTLQVP